MNHVDGLPFEFGCTLNLRFLDISFNNFHTLPYELQNLSQLDYLNFEGNPCSFSFPSELHSENIKSVLNYLHELELTKHVIPLHEGKLIFVGNGDVGKTTLIKKLIDSKFKLSLGKEETTRGIDIRQWDIAIKSGKREYFYSDEEDMNDYFSDEEDMDNYFSNQEINVVLNLWDFGGQEIYHSTHQFFLTKRSIYILVWETRKDEINSNLEYWLNLISLLGGESPILIVQNKVDSRKTELNTLELKERFENIFGFYEISCLNNEGIEKFKSDLIRVVRNLPHLGDKLPKSWVEIKKSLREVNEDFISYDRFLDHCKKFRIEGKRVEFIAEYLHDLGLIIHHKNDFLLRDIVILNPEWATKSVYKLLDSPKIIKNKGRFNESQLVDFWDYEIYPIHKHPHLLRLITKFELCFKIFETDEYLLPELLPIEQYSNKNEYLKDRDLWYEYRYRFFPGGILTRLLCRISHLVEGTSFAKNYFKISYENSSGIIFQNIFERKISIIITGAASSELYVLIRSNIEEIHKTLNIKEKTDFIVAISCSCEECKSLRDSPHFFDIETIKRYQERGRNNIECYKSGESISLQEVTKSYIRNKTFDITSIILLAGLKVQGLRLSIRADENSYNSIMVQIIEQLSSAKLKIKDQSLWGSSSTGKKPGEIDIKIEDLNGNILGLVEAFRLNSLRRETINNHLEKIFKYDSNGLLKNYILIYSEANDYLGLWDQYLNYITYKEYKNPIIGSPKELDNYTAKYSEVNGVYTKHLRSGVEVKLYHFFYNFKNNQ